MDMEQTESELRVLPNEEAPATKQNEGTTTKPKESNADDISQRYQPEIAKPMHKAGGTTISFAQAKLFGLLDENGQIKTNKLKASSISDVTKSLESNAKSRVFGMSQPRAPPPPPKKQPGEGTFTRTKAAIAAMKNGDCGYDFIERLAEKGKFLDNLAAQEKSKKDKNKEKEHLKADYEAKLDKLACPKCKKVQSFDEYFEKKRMCTRCKERFRQVNVSSGGSMLKRMEEQAKKKAETLKKLEDSVYGNDGKPNIPTSSAHKAASGGVLGKLMSANQKQAEASGDIIERHKQSEKLFDSKAKQEQLAAASRRS